MACGIAAQRLKWFAPTHTESNAAHQLAFPETDFNGSTEAFLPYGFCSQFKFNKETKMKFALISAAAVAAAAFATSALAAPRVVSDAAYCVQSLDANCQNLGPDNPYTDSGWQNRNATADPHYHGGPKNND